MPLLIHPRNWQQATGNSRLRARHPRHAPHWRRTASGLLIPRMLEGEKLLGEDGERLLDANGDRVPSNEGGDNCCCGGCAQVPCWHCPGYDELNPNDAPNAPEEWDAVVSGVTPICCPWATKLNGETGYIRAAIPDGAYRLVDRGQGSISTSDTCSTGFAPYAYPCQWDGGDVFDGPWQETSRRGIYTFTAAGCATPYDHPFYPRCFDTCFLGVKLQKRSLVRWTLEVFAVIVYWGQGGGGDCTFESAVPQQAPLLDNEEARAGDCVLVFFGETAVAADAACCGPLSFTNLIDDCDYEHPCGQQVNYDLVNPGANWKQAYIKGAATGGSATVTRRAA